MPTSSNSPDEERKETPERRYGWAGRRVTLLVLAVPVIGLVSILAWGVAQNNGASGRPGVNNSLGEVEVGQVPASDFEIELYGGGTLRLSDLRGKVVMVDFWSSWCPPCRQEAPMLADVYQEYQGMPVEFVGIDIWDTEGGALDYLERYGIPFPSGEDAQGQIAVEYGVRGIPEKYFIGGDGVIRQKFIGPMKRDLLTELLDGYVRELELDELRQVVPDA